MGQATTIDHEAVIDSSASGPQRRHLLGLQYLRGIAATGVVMFHVSAAAGTPWRIGAWGVDLFFVLSGFLMIAITDGGARPWLFFKDRLLRVAPLYWIATAAMVAIGLIGIAPNLALDPARIVASFAFIPYGEVNARGITLPILPVGWTLNAEMLFYTIFAFILFLPRFRMLALTLVIGGLVAAGVLLRPTGAIAAAWTHPIMLEFVAGGWLGMAWVRPARRRLIAALLLVALLLWISKPVGSGLSGGLAGAAVTLVVMTVLVFEQRGAGIPEWRPLRLLGDASYSIYLWQVFPLQFCFIIGARLGLPIGLVAAIAFVAAIGGGILAYLLLERPLLKALHRRQTRRGIIIPSGP